MNNLNCQAFISEISLSDSMFVNGGSAAGPGVIYLHDNNAQVYEVADAIGSFFLGAVFGFFDLDEPKKR